MHLIELPSFYLNSKINIIYYQESSDDEKNQRWLRENTNLELENNLEDTIIGLSDTDSFSDANLMSEMEIISR